MNTQMRHFTECGLSDVYLLNGFEVIDGEWGESVVIADLEGLLKTIGQCIVESENTLNGEKIRFIRKRMDLTQRVLGEMLDMDAQTVAFWEKDKQPIKRPSELILRALFREYLKGGGATSVTAMVKRLAEVDRASHEAKQLRMVNNNGVWSSGECNADEA